MFCTWCGMKCRDDARFCPRCGQKLRNLQKDADKPLNPGEPYDRTAQGSERGRELVKKKGKIPADNPGKKRHTMRNVIKPGQERHTVRNVIIILAVVLAAAGAAGGYFVYSAVQPRRVLDTFLEAVENEEWAKVLDCIEWEGQAGFSKGEFQEYLAGHGDEIRQWSNSTRIHCRNEEKAGEKTALSVTVSKKGMQLASPERELQLVKSEDVKLLFFKEWKLTPESAALILEIQPE